MIDIEYQTHVPETANATLDFLSNRPVLSLLLFGMKICCILLCVGFAIKLSVHEATADDLSITIFALAWIFLYKSVNRWVIKCNLKIRQAHKLVQSFKITRKTIAWKTQMQQTPLKIEWKSLRFVYKNKDGYIIPLTGISNAAKFIWLPFRGFKNIDLEHQFNDLIKTHKLKIKSIK